MSKRSSIILSIILLVSMVAIPIGTVTAQQGPPTGSGPGKGWRASRSRGSQLRRRPLVRRRASVVSRAAD